MNREFLADTLSRFPALRIAVVGDFFLDRYWQIDAQLDEPSIETGLTAYQVVQCRCAPGAAGTVVNNLAALGVGTLYAVGFTGQDGEGYELRKALHNLGVNQRYLLECPNRFTPCYTKPLRSGSELNRFDIKNRKSTPPEIENALIESLRELAGQVDAVMIMDQVSEANCGAVTENVREELIRLASQPSCPVIYADSRERIKLFRNIIVKCNEKELLNVFGKTRTDSLPLEDIGNYGTELAKSTGQPVFITLGERGQLVVGKGGESLTMVPAVYVSGEVDICGAGDAASSGIVASLCTGADAAQAAFIGNLVSSVTIRQLGSTGTATPQQVLDALDAC